jgi:hypothetical protein
MGIYKFGNKYLPSVYKTQFKFRSHFSGGKVHFIGREIQYVLDLLPNLIWVCVYECMCACVGDGV